MASSKQVKHRRGTTVEIENFTPALGELIVNTDNRDLILGDGLKQGGHRVGKSSPEKYGCIGDGVADDTAAMQAYWDAETEVMLTAGKVYSCRNLIIPNKADTVIDLNGATIQARTGGDPYYLIAAYKHINNIAEAQTPVRIKHNNGLIDGNDLVDHPLIVQNWNSLIEAEVRGGLSDGVVFSAETRSGTTFPSSSLVNSRFRLISHANAGAGFRVRDSARNNATDGYILPGSYMYDNGAEGLYIDAGAGWDVQVNTYANAGIGVRFNGVGSGTRVHHGYIDDDVAIQANAHLGVGLLHVDNNIIKGRVTSVGNGDTAPYGVYSHDNQYLNDGHIYHSFFATTRIMHSVNDTFETTDPFRFSSGTSTGKFRVVNSLIVPDDRYVTAAFDATGKSTALRHADNPSLHKGAVFRDQSNQISNGGSFSFDFDIFGLGDSNQKAGTVVILTRQFNNSTTRVQWTGHVVISSKVNGTDSWVVNLVPTVETPAEWTTTPAASVSDNGDGTGTLTITGDPSDTDGYGRVNVIWA